MRLLKYVLTTTLILAGGCHISEAAGFYYKAGIGYDFISQEYFLDSASQAAADSVLTEWSLKTNYLDDFKGFLSLGVSPFGDDRLQLTSKYEQTPDFLRLKFLGNSRTKLGSSRLDLKAELDWKNRHNGTAEFGDSYIFGYSRAKLGVPLNPDLKGIFELRGEFVEFDSASETSYNFYRAGGRVGLEKIYENFSFADLKFSFLTRQVPDSSALNYVDFGLEGSVLGLYEQGEADLYARLGRKDYNQIDGRNDFWRLELDGRNKVRLGENSFVRQILQFDMTRYDPNDPVNLDYYLFELTFLAGIENTNSSLGIGPQFEILHEAKDDFAVSEDYFEIGAAVDFDLIKARKYFVSIESVIGRRDLKDNTDLLTDYTFERLNFIGDVKFFKRLSLNVFFSAEWEWHTISTNNSEIYLLSSSLAYGL